jgi:citrate lyase subunit beta-like protein
MVPKVESAADLTFVVDVLNSVQASAQVSEKPAFKILPLIESAKGLLNLNEICRASPYVSGLVFAAEDFCHDLGITRTAQLTELLFARSAVVTAVRAHRLTSAIDLVTTSFKNEAGAQQLEHECAQGRRLGFNGKQLIHPAQIDAAQRLFSPSVKDLQWAVRIVIADEKADAHGRGAWTLDGKMVDVPVVRRAQAIVANAEACEMDVQSLKDEWEDQQPE